jgi:hypothetical protein
VTLRRWARQAQAEEAWLPLVQEEVQQVRRVRREGQEQEQEQEQQEQQLQHRSPR